MRHWDAMQQDGEYWCGEFDTDDVDWRLAELLVNIQFACQRHYFGAMAEKYFDDKLREASANVQHKQKTFEAFLRLPEEFCVEDVQRCFQFASSAAARMRINRLLKDHLIEKADMVKTDNTYKAIYRKTGVAML